MAIAAKMPETPQELEGFIREVVEQQRIQLQRETLEEVRHLGERQARVDGRLEELARVVTLYREDFQGLREDFRSLLERFDHFQTEVRRENEAFRQEMRSENERFRQEMRSESERFRQEMRSENERFRQAVWERFEKVDQQFEKVDQQFEKVDQQFEKVDQRFERLEGRLFEMQRSLTVQTRWLVALLVAAPVIYSVVDRLLGRLLP